MSYAVRRRRILLATEYPDEALSLGRELPVGWEVEQARSAEHARFLLQHAHYDALLWDEQFLGVPAPEALGPLLALRSSAVVLLTDLEPATVARALEGDADSWLPRELALGSPEALRAALEHAFRHQDLLRRARQARQAYRACRQRTIRLLGLLWQTAPSEDGHWLSQRQVLERLREETDRCQRYGTGLSVAVAELPPALAAGTAARVLPAKRQCDIVGQYGPHGFLLLLPQTPESGAAVCCRRLQEVLAQSNGRATFGIAGYSAQTPALANLLGRAEKQLEAAKQNGGVAF